MTAVPNQFTDKQTKWREGKICDLDVEPDVACREGQKQKETNSMRKIQIATMAAAALLAGAWTASASITVNSGDISTLDSGATSYGAVRFKDFTNTKDGGDAGNLYLANTGGQLGSNPNSDGRARVQASP